MSDLKNEAGSAQSCIKYLMMDGSRVHGSFTATVLNHLGVDVPISSAAHKVVPARQYGQQPLGAPLSSPRLATVL